MEVTIPAAITQDHDIEPGDVFAVETDTDDEDRLVLEYVRVYNGE